MGKRGPRANLFDLIAPDYHAWQRMADSLKSAATAAADDWARRMSEKVRMGTLDLGDLGAEPHVVMLLAGLAVENLAIGLKVRHEGVRAGCLPRGVGKHEIAKYLKDVTFTLSDQERRLVARLERYVRWQGRYPVATKRRADRPARALKLAEFEGVLKLYERLNHALVSFGGGGRP